MERYHDKLASLTFFDPACGSGNFLTETYISLRRLENKVLSELLSHQGVFGFTPEHSPLKVSLAQFHGIEINDFAANVAATALWIAELQANAEAQTIVYQMIEDLPLRDSANIALGNALEVGWEEVLPAEQCDYIIGNPPFLGYSGLNEEQKADRARIFGKAGGVLDYVACWYRIAADYMRGTKIEGALVSTNSICQGQQVQPLWQPLVEGGLQVNFAHRTFPWKSESLSQAAVHVIIVGFSYVERADKVLFTYDRSGVATLTHVEQINAYLVDAPHAFITRRSKPLSPVPLMLAGGKPSEGGNLLLSRAERDEMVKAEPAAEKWIRRYSMGEEFIDGTERFCLWLEECPPHELTKMPLVLERVRGVKEMREASSKLATRQKAATPWLFDEIKYRGAEPYLAVPSVSSERRCYIPVGFVTDGMVPGNMLYFINGATAYDFGILTSRVHNAWMRTVAGRLKSDYRYANTIVYNNFIWPDPDASQWAEIEEAAQAVLDAREKYQGSTLEALYDPDNAWLYPDLLGAHEALDTAVERAYGLQPGLDEKDVVAHLFELYSAAVGSAG